MKKWINEFADGDRLEITVMLANVNRGVTAKGAPYLSFVFQDKSGQIDAKFWNVSEEQLSIFKPGMLVVASGDVLSHNKQLQFRVMTMKESEDEGLDVRDYVKSSPYSEEHLRQRIQEKVDSIQNEKLHILLQALMEEYDDKFYAYPAAAKNHHDFAGGLATHVLGMLDLAEAMASLYPMLHRDLLIAGVLAHDLGKLVELSGAIVTEYTIEGKLLGHISIMQAKIDTIAQQLGIEGEEVVLLRHMVLSHHGVYEYGSPVLPMIPEAEALYLIDNMDARMNTLEKALHPLKPGEFTPRIFALENRSFYKSKE